MHTQTLKNILPRTAIASKGIKKTKFTKNTRTFLRHSVMCKTVTASSYASICFTWQNVKPPI